MRHHGVVVARREAQTVYYRISDGKVAEVVSVLYTLYCSDDD
jgi:DNA-binding transcriptional ArsR family regulator